MLSEKLIQLLEEQTKTIVEKAENLNNLNAETLTWRENSSSWNVLECIEHLNLYGDFYLPEFENKIKNSKTANENEFKNGLLGGYFAKSMLPKEKLNKMKTFKDKNPLNAQLDTTVISKFINQQKELLKILQQAKLVSLNKVKISISITSLLKLKLGDALHFYLNHIQRHMLQIEKIIGKQNF